MRMVRDFGMAREVRDGAKAAAEPTSRASAMMVPRMVMEEEEAKSDVGVRSAREQRMHAVDAQRARSRDRRPVGDPTRRAALNAQVFFPLNCR